MLFWNVSVADEPGFVVETQLVKESEGVSGKTKIEGRNATLKRKESSFQWFRTICCLAPSIVPCSSSPRGTSWPALRCIRWVSSCE